MGLQHTTKRCIDDRSSDVFFVTILQGWVYKMRDACEQSDACLTQLQGWAYNTQQRDELMIV